MYGGQSSHIPMKVNQSGVIPVIFASSLLAFPQTIAMFMGADAQNFVQTYLSPIKHQEFGYIEYLKFC